MTQKLLESVDISFCVDGNEFRLKRPFSGPSDRWVLYEMLHEDKGALGIFLDGEISSKNGERLLYDTAHAWVERQKANGDY